MKKIQLAFPGELLHAYAWSFLLHSLNHRSQVHKPFPSFRRCQTVIRFWFWSANFLMLIAALISLSCSVLHCRIRKSDYSLSLFLERSVRLSPHSAQAFYNPFCIGQRFDFNLTAFAILVCSLLTRLSTVFQLMYLHWRGRSESASLSPEGVVEYLAFKSLPPFMQ